jgi:glycosyltransferase involved in cell wall biosynthesis
LKDEATRKRIKAKGRAFVLSAHQPEELARKYFDAISTVIRKKIEQDQPLKTLIDVRWMKPGVAGGIENLARSFLDHLINLDQYNEYILMVPSEIKYDFDLRNRRNIKIWPLDGLKSSLNRFFWQGENAIRHLLKADSWRTRQVENLTFAGRFKADVALTMSGYLSTDLFPLRNVVVVADLQHEYYPEFFVPEALEERKRILNDTVHGAAHIIAISEYTRQTLLERFRISPERVSTVHLAADSVYTSKINSGEHCRLVLRKYKLGEGGYLFFPANTWPHKNHQAAIRALQILRAEYHLDPILVCTGSEKQAHQSILAMIKEAGLCSRVRFLGYCPVEDMPSLYRNAAALVFPSLFEGFGIPLVEAMWSDCPIVCSNATSLPEIAGDAALLFDPRAPEQLAEALNQVLTDEAVRQSLVQRGRDQAKKFSWHRFTQETVRVLHDVRRQHYGNGED